MCVKLDDKRHVVGEALVNNGHMEFYGIGASSYRLGFKVFWTTGRLRYIFCLLLPSRFYTILGKWFTFDKVTHSFGILSISGALLFQVQLAKYLISDKLMLTDSK